MKRLLVFPAYPSRDNGYGIAVNSDYTRLNVDKNDIIIWYATKEDKTNHGIWLPRFSKYSYRRLLNVISRKPSTELSSDDFKMVNVADVDEVFCGDVMFYRALRELFPNKTIHVRFHNCYARINDRVNLLGVRSSLSLSFKLNLDSFYRLEREIMRDPNVQKIFISDEDRDYYVTNFGHSKDSEVWGFAPQLELLEKNREQVDRFTKVVWFGGLDSHKIDSVKWFVEEVFSTLKTKYPWLEFHLYGKGSDAFDNQSQGVYGHGFYNGYGMPYKNEALYINPDLTGGGVKIKLMSYFENGVTFLTSPYGYEGYPRELIDNKYCFVKETDEWLQFLTDFFKGQK